MNARRWEPVSAKEFREYADECFDWAKTAKSDKERNIFLQMAQTWLEAVARAEGVSAVEQSASPTHGQSTKASDGASPPER